MTSKHQFDKRKQHVNETLSTNEYYIPMNVTFEALAVYKQCGKGNVIPLIAFEGFTQEEHRYFANVDDVGDQCVNFAIPDVYFKLCFGNALPPPVQAKCLCGQRIKEQCYRCPKNNPTPEQVIVVGNECIGRFGVMKGHMCEIRGVKHLNRSFNVCGVYIKIKVKVSSKYTNLAK